MKYRFDTCMFDKQNQSALRTSTKTKENEEIERRDGASRLCLFAGVTEGVGLHKWK